MSEAKWGSKVDLNPGGALAQDLSTAITVALACGKRVAVSRIRLVTTVAQTTALANITVFRRKADGTGSVTLGTFVLPLTGSVVNQVQFVNLIEPSTTGAAGADSTASLPTLVYTTTNKGPVYLEADDVIGITSDAGGATGTYNVYFEGWDEGFNEKNTTKVATELAFVAA